MFLPVPWFCCYTRLQSFESCHCEVCAGGVGCEEVGSGGTLSRLKSMTADDWGGDIKSHNSDSSGLFCFGADFVSLSRCWGQSRKNRCWGHFVQF